MSQFVNGLKELQAASDRKIANIGSHLGTACVFGDYDEGELQVDDGYYRVGDTFFIAGDVEFSDGRFDWLPGCEPPKQETGRQERYLIGHNGVEVSNA